MRAYLHPNIITGNKIEVDGYIYYHIEDSDTNGRIYTLWLDSDWTPVKKESLLRQLNTAYSNLID